MLRVALVTWVFPLSGTWDTLMVIYPVTWSFMIVAMLVSYFIVRRRCYRSIEPAAAEDGVPHWIRSGVGRSRPIEPAAA